MRTFMLGRTLALLAMGLAVWLPAPAAAASPCGGKGERACCVLERVPSCDKGLTESGTCKKNCDCGKGPGSSIGMCVDASPDITSCGGKGERGCCVNERSSKNPGPCHGDLVEDLKPSCMADRADHKCKCAPMGMVALYSAGICKERPGCGAKGGKPCTLDVQISQGRKSCNAGLVEDFIKNECVEPTPVLTEANCRAVVGLMRSKVVPDFMKPYVAAANKKKGERSKAELIASAAAYVEPLKPLVPELQRVYEGTVKAKEIFDPDTLCVPARLQAKLNSLGGQIKPVVKTFLPTYSGAFHMAYTLNASIAAGPGIAAGYAVATDYMGGTGVYVYLGPSVVFNASLGDSIGVQFYPKVTLDSFEGWGLGVGVSGGPPSKIFSGGVDVPMSDRGLPLGIGVSGGIGLGALPVDIGVSATHSWKIWSTK